MSVCPKCGASVSMYDTGGTPWYACGSKGTFRSGSCVDREPVATQLREAQQRIKTLEEFVEQLTNPKFTRDDLPKEALLQRIKRLEETLDKTTKIASQRIKRLEDSYAAKDAQLSNLLNICRANGIDVSSQDLIHGKEAKL